MPRPQSVCRTKTGYWTVGFRAKPKALGRVLWFLPRLGFREGSPKKTYSGDHPTSQKYADNSTQLFQPLGEKLSYYNENGFQVTILDSKAPES